MLAFLKIPGVNSSQNTWAEKRELDPPGTSGDGYGKKEKRMSGHLKEDDVSPGVLFMQISIAPSRGGSH